MEDAQDDAWQVEREYLEEGLFDEFEGTDVKGGESHEVEASQASEVEASCVQDPYQYHHHQYHQYIKTEPQGSGLEGRAKTANGGEEPSGPSETSVPLSLLPRLLRFLSQESQESQDGESFDDVTTSSLVVASRRLWRLGALEPQGYGLPPKVSSLGTWLAKCSETDLPPPAARALFFGALWGCLVPLAALVALLLPLEGNVTPKKSLRTTWRNRLRKGIRKSNWSGHFVLVASYLKWKERKESRAKQEVDPSNAEIYQEMLDQNDHNQKPLDSGNDQGKIGIDGESLEGNEGNESDGDDIAGSGDGSIAPVVPMSGFWEVLDAKVIALCKFVQTDLGYDGEDIGRRKPWTVTSEDQHPLVLAALCAAFPPRRRPGDWVVQADLAEGFLEVESRVSNAHACLFAPSAPRWGDGEIEMAGIQVSLKPGMDASFKEACAIRALLSSSIELAFKDSIGMSREVIQRALDFLSSPSGDFFICLDDEPREGTAEEVGLGVLTLLGRTDASTACGGPDRSTALRRGGYKDAVRGRMVPSLPGLPASRPWWSSQSAGASSADMGKRRKGLLPSQLAELATMGSQGDISEDLPENQSRESQNEARNARGAVDAADAPDAGATDVPSEAKCVEDWATGLVQAALLKVLKQRAAAVEEFDVAARLKARERGAETALAAGRARAIQLLQAPKLAAVEQLRERKRKAVEVEDYELAGRLKRDADTMEAKIDATLKEASLEDVALEEARRLASKTKHRFKLLKAAGSDAMASSTATGLWEDVTSILTGHPAQSGHGNG